MAKDHLDIRIRTSDFGAPLYRVAWVNPATGAEGAGTALLPRHAAEEMAAQCNELDPEAIYWAVRGGEGDAND